MLVLKRLLWTTLVATEANEEGLVKAAAIRWPPNRLNPRSIVPMVGLLPLLPSLAGPRMVGMEDMVVDTDDAASDRCRSGAAKDTGIQWEGKEKREGGGGDLALARWWDNSSAFYLPLLWPLNKPLPFMLKRKRDQLLVGKVYVVIIKT